MKLSYSFLIQPILDTLYDTLFYDIERLTLTCFKPQESNSLFTKSYLIPSRTKYKVFRMIHVSQIFRRKLNNFSNRTGSPKSRDYASQQQQSNAITITFKKKCNNLFLMLNCYPNYK